MPLIRRAKTDPVSICTARSTSVSAGNVSELLGAHEQGADVPGAGFDHTPAVQGQRVRSSREPSRVPTTSTQLSPNRPSNPSR